MADARTHGLSRVGQTVANRYHLLRVIGAGGMGTVYDAIDTTTAGRVAIKVMRRDLAEDPVAVERFVLEGKAATSIVSLNIVRVLDVGHDLGMGFYIAQEFLDGCDLRHWLKSLQRLKAQDALELMLPITRALVAAHERQVLHRDIKPENIFLTRTSDGEIVPKLIDFGLSKMLEQPHAPIGKRNRTLTGVALGTPEYMSPEQVRGQRDADGRSDIWSVGVVLYELLTGVGPFASTTKTFVMLKIMNERAVPVAQCGVAVPEALGKVVDCALSHDPDKRYLTMRAMHAAMLQCSSRRLETHTAHPSQLPSEWQKEPSDWMQSDPEGHHSVSLPPARRDNQSGGATDPDLPSLDPSDRYEPPAARHPVAAPPGRPARVPQPFQPAATNAVPHAVAGARQVRPRSVSAFVIISGLTALLATAVVLAAVAKRQRAHVIHPPTILVNPPATTPVIPTTRIETPPPASPVVAPAPAPITPRTNGPHARHQRPR